MFARQRSSNPTLRMLPTPAPEGSHAANPPQVAGFVFEGGVIRDLAGGGVGALEDVTRLPLHTL